MVAVSGSSDDLHHAHDERDHPVSYRQSRANAIVLIAARSRKILYQMFAQIENMPLH